MEPKHISDFLKKQRNVVEKYDVNNEIILFILNKYAKDKIKQKDIEIKLKTLKIKTKPIILNEIILNQENIFKLFKESNININKIL